MPMTFWLFRDEPVIVFLRLATLGLVLLGGVLGLPAYVLR